MRRHFSQHSLLSDQRGTATLEYLIVLLTVAIGLTFAVIALGPRLVDYFEVRVMWLSLPLP